MSTTLDLAADGAVWLMLCTTTSRLLRMRSCILVRDMAHPRRHITVTSSPHHHTSITVQSCQHLCVVLATGGLLLPAAVSQPLTPCLAGCLAAWLPGWLAVSLACGVYRGISSLVSHAAMGHYRYQTVAMVRRMANIALSRQLEPAWGEYTVETMRVLERYGRCHHHSVSHTIRLPSSVIVLLPRHPRRHHHRRCHVIIISIIVVVVIASS